MRLKQFFGLSSGKLDHLGTNVGAREASVRPSSKQPKVHQACVPSHGNQTSPLDFSEIGLALHRHILGLEAYSSQNADGPPSGQKESNMAEKKIRIQYEISETNLKRIEELMKITGAETRKELFNNALTILGWAARNSQKGLAIGAINEENNTFRELQTPALEHAAAYRG
ncbi:hypothetical protein [Acanthopleuribacter pedis]|uniref:Uncharacterized protein n=1 Tax=Acanthopleuribacter pedis TaxID=442870 RepID=A0A8J7QG62_9BACT|nr:hypothetical protein [Acanthopleuribacter pedis]MBO1317920.1 hypothetical protein [Acanthopleuribacter pedis]